MGTGMDPGMGTVTGMGMVMGKMNPKNHAGSRKRRHRGTNHAVFKSLIIAYLKT